LVKAKEVGSLSLWKKEKK